MKATDTQRKQRHQPPNEAFRLLFQYLWGQSAQPTHTDRLQLYQPLTAVCQAWRASTLPIFYQTIVCSIRQKRRGKGIGYDKKTNLPLILSAAEHRRYVRRLVIELTGDVAPTLPIALLSRAGFDALEWPEIDRLELTHRYLRQARYSGDALAQLNAYLLHRLPGLTTIVYRGPGDRKHYSEFPLDCLLSSRLSQLRQVCLHSGIPPRIGRAAFLPGLTRLTLNCPVLEGASNLPRFFAETLEHLAMGFSSAETLWDRFYACTGTMTVEFSRLRTLDLRYSVPLDSERRRTLESRARSLYRECEESSDEQESSDEEDDACAIQGGIRCAFPMLTHLSVARYPHAITRVLRHFDLPRIPHIVLRDVAHGWENVAPEHLCGKTGSVQVDLATQPKGQWEHAYQMWVNRVFSLGSGVTSMRLSAPLAERATLPDIIGLTSLRDLSLGLPLDAATIPRLLFGLPRLLHLAVHVHPESTWRERNAGVIESCPLDRLPPLSTTLQRLVIYIDSCVPSSTALRKRGRDDYGEPADVVLPRVVNKVSPMEIDWEVAWVVARVPSLVEFCSEKVTSAAVEQCIDEIVAGLDDAQKERFGRLKRLHYASWVY